MKQNNTGLGSVEYLEVAEVDWDAMLHQQCKKAGWRAPQWRQLCQVMTLKQCSVAAAMINCQHLQLTVAGCQQPRVVQLSPLPTAAHPAVHQQLLSMPKHHGHVHGQHFRGQSHVCSRPRTRTVPFGVSRVSWVRIRVSVRVGFWLL